MFLQCGKFRLSLGRPLIMGVVNITPDSFFDGGRYFDPTRAAAHARRLIDEGADIVDVGGESTRPGSRPVALDEESLRDCGVPVSVDTRKPELMLEAVAAGATMVNDIGGLRAPGVLAAMAGAHAAVCFMHMRGEPQTMQEDPRYDDVVAEVRAFLADRIDAAERAGIMRERIVVDPGFGFGKAYEHSMTLLRALGDIAALGVPVLVGLSRKSMLGRITGRAADERIFASVAAALIAVQNGAHIVRVHDVAATRDALAVWRAVKDQNQ
jgi:dihydropteroate synthase